MPVDDASPPGLLPYRVEHVDHAVLPYHVEATDMLRELKATESQKSPTSVDSFSMKSRVMLPHCPRSHKLSLKVSKTTREHAEANQCSKFSMFFQLLLSLRLFAGASDGYSDGSMSPLYASAASSASSSS